MVHNGIEYGDMQLICEAYNLMKDTLGMSHDGKFFKNFKKRLGVKMKYYFVDISVLDNLRKIISIYVLIFPS